MFKWSLVGLMMLFKIVVFAAEDMEREAQKVLDKLYQVNGNQVFEKPTITITKDKKHGALYLRSANQIELSEKAYSVCQGFDDDYPSALAFIIGHELSHAYQKEAETSFLQHEHYHKSDISAEETADIQGVLMAGLAGYKTLDLMPTVIERIYEEFDLNEHLKGYPSLEERKKTTQKTQQKAKELLAIYKAGNYMLAIGKYDLSIACFEHVQQWYQGVEVYNNLGTAAILKALDLTKNDTEPYVFPLEINWTSRLRLPARGTVELPSTVLKNYDNCLKQAKKYFKIAEKMKPDDISIKSNLMCVWILNQQEKKALKKGLKWLEKSKYSNNQAFKLALALAFAYNEKTEDANKIWKTIIENKQSPAMTQAQNNLQLHAGRICYVDKQACPLVTCTQENIDGIRIHRSASYPSEDINLVLSSTIKVNITTKNQYLFYLFEMEEESFALQRVLKKCASSTNWTSWKNQNIFLSELGGIVSCECDGFAFKLDPSGNIAEWAKFD